MKTIRATCDNCQKVYSVREEHAGRRAKCRECGYFFWVPDKPPAAEHTTDNAEDLVSCSYCGFQDIGNFCSQCGSRLDGSPITEFQKLRIPEDLVGRLQTLLHDRAEEDDEFYQIQDALDAIESIDEQIKMTLTEMQRSGGEYGAWELSRLDLEEWMATIERVTPLGDHRQVVWAFVSDCESTARRQEEERPMRDHAEQVQRNVEVGSLRAATTALVKYRNDLKDTPKPEDLPTLEELEALVAGLAEHEEREKLEKEFTKVHTKAEKLAFTGETKKAIKAYKEALFWLSKNQLPDHANIQRSIETKLSELET